MYINNVINIDFKWVYQYGAFNYFQNAICPVEVYDLLSTKRGLIIDGKFSNFVLNDSYSDISYIHLDPKNKPIVGTVRVYKN